MLRDSFHKENVKSGGCMLTKHHDLYNKIRYTIGGAIAAGFCLWLVIDTVDAHGHVDFIDPAIGVELEVHRQWEEWRSMEYKYEQMMDRMDKQIERETQETHDNCNYDGGWLGSSGD